MGNRFGRSVRRSTLALIVAAGLAGVAGAAQATLMGRDLNGDSIVDAYYDTVFNITWLANANYAATDLNSGATDARRNAIIANVASVANTGGAPHTLTTADFQKVSGTYTGRMTWWGAMAWAQDLVFGGYGDWRLAVVDHTSPTGTPHNCNTGSGGAAVCVPSGNELGYMHYIELDSGNNTGDQTSVDGALLKNIQPSYWSGTEGDTDNALGFSFSGGSFLFADKGLFQFSAWAVRPGDVIAAAPEPASLLLVGLGVLGLEWSRRRGQRR